MKTMTSSFTRNLKTTSNSRERISSKKVDERYTLYGFSKIKT